MSETLAEWQSARRAELSSPESWLGMRGLFWLEPGVNRVGSGEDARVRLPEGPAHLGDVVWDDERITWHPIAGIVQVLVTDRLGPATTVDHENLSFFIVDREGRLAARVRDRAWAETQPFPGLHYFPAAAEWRKEASWQMLDTPIAMEVPNVSGELKTVTVTHQAVFEHGGEMVALLPMSVSEREVFFVFRDRTSGRQTYGAGRFLKASPPVDGQLTVDFNRAFNPPCAFTPFATCPLPPPENWLNMAVLAGECKPGFAPEQA